MGLFGSGKPQASNADAIKTGQQKARIADAKKLGVNLVRLADVKQRHSTGTGRGGTTIKGILH